MWHSVRKQRHLKRGHALVKTRLPGGVEYECNCGKTWFRRGH